MVPLAHVSCALRTARPPVRAAHSSSPTDRTCPFPLLCKAWRPQPQTLPLGALTPGPVIPAGRLEMRGLRSLGLEFHVTRPFRPLYDVPGSLTSRWGGVLEGPRYAPARPELTLQRDTKGRLPNKASRRAEKQSTHRPRQRRSRLPPLHPLSARNSQAGLRMLSPASLAILRHMRRSAGCLRQSA